MADHKAKRNREKITEVVADWRKDTGYAQNRDKAALAQLRGIKPTTTDDYIEVIDVGAAICAPAFQALYRSVFAYLTKMEDRRGIPRTLDGDDLEDRLALVAGVLAYVKKDIGGELGGALKNKGYSDLRFRRLLRLSTDAELLREGRRLVRMLDGDVPVASLARALLFWDAQETRALARSYYHAELSGQDATTDGDTANTDTSNEDA